ncbi:MAG: amino acid-binding protein [Prevotella sp.]|jgi:hypothetical protein|nr:amino acid-binding protein [Prevotella sp.]
MISQLSIFVENKPGALEQVLRLFKDSHIDLVTTTLADTQDFGLFRVICADPQRACLMLKDNGITVTLTKVQAIELDNRPGMAADALQTFAADDLNVRYMYSFLLGGKGILVLRTDNIDKASQLIQSKGFQSIDDDDLRRML